MNNVEEQLECTQRLNMRDFKIAIEKLRSLDSVRYKNAEPKITSDLANCIMNFAKVNPDYARDAKRYALMIFDKNPTLTALEINDLDGCQLSIAGLGARGSRTVCKDSLKVGGSGPTMVVVPAASKIKAFAIAKYEVSINEYNSYCTKTKGCKPLKAVSGYLPATNLAITDITRYIKWLNKQTDKKYRLPLKREWQHAAQANGSRLDSNRNCQIKTRGIDKGKELLKTTTGKGNKWGLVNYAGNAQELVYLSGRRLAAMGGSFQTSMDKCTSSEEVAHTGKADAITGFRLVRDIKG